MSMTGSPVTMTGSGLALQIRGLRVTARRGGRSIQILRDLDLDLRSGEILGVVGESGSGKSTLCRAIARLLPGGLVAESGTIRMGDVDVLGIRPGQLHRMPSRGVRMVFQNPMTALNPVMTVGGQCTEAARAWHGLAGVCWRQEAVEDARAAFEQALAVLGPGDSTEAAETLLRLAELNAVSLGLADVGLAHGERALAMVERLHDRRLEAAVCFTMGSVRTWRCEPAGGRALLERALTLAKAQDDPVLISEVCGILASACAFTGDLRASLAVTLEREQAALRTQDLYQLRHVPGWQAQMAMFRGDWSECEQLLEQAQQVVDHLETPEPRAIARCIRGGIDYYRGRFRAAEGEFRAAFEEIRAVETGSVLWVLPWLPWALAELGRSDEALGIWAEVEQKLESRERRSTQYASRSRWHLRLPAVGGDRTGGGVLPEADRLLGCFYRHVHGPRSGSGRHLR